MGVPTVKIVSPNFISSLVPIFATIDTLLLSILSTAKSRYSSPPNTVASASLSSDMVTVTLSAPSTT